MDITDIVRGSLHNFIVKAFLENVRFCLFFSFLLASDLIVTSSCLFTAKEYALPTPYLRELRDILCDDVIVLLMHNALMHNISPSLNVLSSAIQYNIKEEQMKGSGSPCKQ